MENKDKLAFASTAISSDGNSYHQDGLTKREYFAAMAMQGLLSNKYFQVYKEGKLFVDVVAKTSIEMADELLNQLNQKQ